MTKDFATFLIVLDALLLAWIIWSALADRSIEQPNYTVQERYNGFEIRSYESYLEASVAVRLSGGPGAGSAFRTAFASKRNQGSGCWVWSIYCN